MSFRLDDSRCDAFASHLTTKPIPQLVNMPSALYTQGLAGLAPPKPQIWAAFHLPKKIRAGGIFPLYTLSPERYIAWY